MAKKFSNNILCCKCGFEGKETNYYMSKSVLYKHLERLPICKPCIEELYNFFFTKYVDQKIALYEMCKKLDMPFHNSIFEGSINEEQFAVNRYFTVLNSFRKKNGYADDFDSGEKIEEKTKGGKSGIKDNEVDLETQIFWGFGFDFKDYMFLETEIAKWKQTHKCDNQAELTLLKEICIKILEIRMLREERKNVSKEQKELQELMKTASVDPAKSNAVNSGDNVDRFGVWLKDIEQLKPAEWWENQEKYKDMDGFMHYINNYIVRPIRNFFTGSKDFLINGEDLSFVEKEVEENE